MGLLMRAMRPAANEQRNGDLAQIHIAKKQLAMEDDAYRALLWAIGRVRSAADLDFTGRKRVLEHLRKCGFQPALKRPASHGSRRGNAEWGWVDTAAGDRQPMLRKIIMLARSGGYGKRYIEGTCANMFGIERLELVAPDQLHKLITALVKDQQRKAAREAGR